ncbi:MAG: mobile mystery protein A [Chitinophagaceae bacterium]|nr:MAG: mobile mystery protein A [Chitinophagaceae bacterium]
MNTKIQKAILEQVSLRLQQVTIPTSGMPAEGWVRTIRKAINMNVVQLARKMKIKAPGIVAFEKREAAGTITINSLKQIAEALDMQLVYAIVPKNGTLAGLVENKAKEKAYQIIDRTNMTMALEDQQTDYSRISEEYREKTRELADQMPRFLWD